MPTSQELARQNLINQYGGVSQAAEAARRFKSGQYTAEDTQRLSTATGMNDAAAKASAALNPKPVTSPTPVAPVAPITPVVPAQIPSPLIPIATPTVGVVERPAVGASSTPVPVSTTGSTDADKFLQISAKDPTKLTEEERTFMRQINAKAALMGGVSQALGMDGTTFGGNRVEMSSDVKLTNRTDGTPSFILTDANGVQRVATPAEAEQIRRSTVGKNAEKAYQEQETARKQLEASQASFESEKARRAQADQEAMKAYEQTLRATADKSIASIREQGNQRKSTIQNNFSAMGGGRSTDALKSVDEVQKSIDQQVQAEEAKYQAQVQMYLLQQQNADAEALKPYRDAINNLDIQLGQLQATAFQRMQEANQKGQVQNEQALQNLLSTMTTQAKAELSLAGFDQAESAKLGYFVKKDAQGNVVPLTDKNGNPIEFKKATLAAAKAPNVQKIGQDDNGVDIMGYWDETQGKFVRADVGVTGATGTPAETGGASDFRTDRNLNPTAMTTDVARSLGMVEGKDFVQGDPFTSASGKTLYTAKMLVPTGVDAIANTVRQFDEAVASGKNLFSTKSGTPRWTHTSMTNQQWSSLSEEEKRAAVEKMYKNEGGSGVLSQVPTQQPSTGGVLSAAQKSQIDALKGDFFSKSGLATLKKAGVTKDQVDAYLNSKQQEAGGSLTDDQRIFLNQIKTEFRSDPQIKAFEDSIASWNTVKSSLEDVSGAGDMAGIFAFMKTLDPSSTVREGEFQLAASSAGVARKAWNTIYNKLWNGEILDDGQRKDFARIAKKYVENRSETYKRKYEDMKRSAQKMKIDTEFLPVPATAALELGSMGVADTGNVGTNEADPLGILD
jgi:hypothetical protein